MMISARIATLLALSLLSACGGMTRTVGVFPNTMDDLGRKSETLRGGQAPVPAQVPAG